MLEKGFVIAERYRIIEKIGAGGMAVVYKARCQKLDRDVAIKVLREEYLDNDDFVKKFKAEAIQASKLTHPNIINIYDVGFEKDLYYIVMEYVKGNTLKQLINNAHEIDLSSAMDIIIKVAEALNSAHKEGVIHRDIKSQNIIITEDGIVKVADFGIATATTTSTLSVTSNAIGSVHYFSPEQAKGETVDIRSDIYSFGVVMFEVFTKRLPFLGDSPVAVALKHVTDEFPQPSNFNKEISLNLDRIIMKCTKKNPNERYSNLTELISELQTEFENIKKGNRDESSNSKQEQIEDENKSSWAVVNIRKKKEYIDDKEVAATVSTEKKQENTDNAVEEEKLVEEAEEVSNKPSEIELLDIKHSQSIENGSVVETEEESEEILEEQFESKEESEEEKIAMKALKGDEDKKGDRLIYISAILTSLVIIAVITLFGYSFIKDFQKSLILEVPDFVGKSYTDAESDAKKLGIVLNKANEVNSDDVKAGTIIDQNFKPGQKIQKNDTIDVVISKGVEMLTVPNIVGEDYNKIKTNLEDKGFNVKVETINDGTVAEGIIVSQDPEVGAKIKKTDVLTISISLGKELSNITVPNVVNISEASAKKTLEDANLKIGTVKTQINEKVVKGNVISQSVKAGSKVNANTVINLVVSIGGKNSANSIFNANGTATTTPVTKPTVPATTTPTTPVAPEKPNEVFTKSLVLDIKPVEALDKDKLPVLITRTSGSKLSLLYNQIVLKNEFPFTFKAEGNPGDVIKVYIDGKVQVEDVIK